MSFEGYYQVITEEGKYFEIDVYEDLPENVLFSNIVDYTNANLEDIQAIGKAFYKYAEDTDSLGTEYKKPIFKYYPLDPKKWIKRPDSSIKEK